jgi:ribosomal protein L37AE/L43A
MTTTRSASSTATPELLAYATCPLCRTTATAPPDGADDGAWVCGRCGQRWTAARLASVTAYAAWVARATAHPVGDGASLRNRHARER